jgi:hypothetical protein
MIKTSKTIDVTPTWESVVPVLAHIIRHATTNGAVDDIMKELKKMAQAADRWNAYCQENK